MTMTDEKVEQQHIPNTQNRTQILTLFTTMIAIVALVIGILSWTRQNQDQLSMSNHIKQQLSLYNQQSTMEINTLSQNLNNQQKLLTLKLDRLNTHNPNVRVLSEVDYLLRLANLNLTLGNNTQRATRLMSLADQRLKEHNNPAQNNLRTAIIHDMRKISAYPKIDVTGILIQLDTLINQVNQFHAVPNKMPNTVTTSNQSSTDSSWRSKWHRALGQLKSLIIIRHRKEKNYPALSPEQFAFLKDDIGLSFAKAQWAVLHQNNTLYQHALTRASRWLNQFSIDNTDQVKPIIKTIQKLEKQNITPQYPSILSSLELVDRALNNLPLTNSPTHQQIIEEQTGQPSSHKKKEKHQDKGIPNNHSLPDVTKGVEV